MAIDWLRHPGVPAKLLRFALVGGLSTLAYGLFTWSLVERGGFTPLAATLLGYLLCIPLNFLLHRGFTFRSEDAVQRQAPRYLLVHGGNILASLAAMYLATDVLRVDYRWGVLATMTLVPVLMFLMLDSWVFRKQRRHFR